MGSDEGLKSAREYPLWDAIFGRRSRRVAAGASFRSGTFSFQSKLEPQPLSKLEEAMLIASTGITGLAFADNPYETTGGQPLLGTPLIEARGRAAGSPDNAQSTHFFMWNDEGTYLLKAPPARGTHPDVRTMSADELIAHAEKSKVKVKDGRVDFPRTFPTYASGNRYVSNVPGSTMFVPVTEVTRQYINGLFYVLAQEPGQRPMFVDDFNLFVPCGCERWVKSKFLNRDIPIPLSVYGKGRTEYESLLLLQNLALVSQSMGLGGWIHAAFAPPILLGGYPDIGPGLGFRFQKPKGIPLPRPYPASVENPVGLDGILQSYAPPYFKDTDAAIDAILAEKYGPGGLYHDGATANPGMKPDSAAAFAREASHVEPEVVEVVREICRYIWRTYGRFPAHCNAIDSSGVWMQCHHIDPEFYQQHFTEAFSSTQAAHAKAWHEGSPAIVHDKSKPDFGMIDWTDAQLDDMFLRSEARPLDDFLNHGEHRVDLDSHEIYNDRRWKGFMPRGLPASEATARLSLGFAKKLWKEGTGFGGETQYFGGTIVTEHTVQEITLDRQTHDLPPGRYVLLGYKDPVFENLFYDLLKPISDNLMLFRGYTGQFPDGRRGWTALLLRRYPFAHMGIDDHDLLSAGRSTPTDEDLLGSWRLDALYYSNQPVQIARIRFDRSANGQLHIDCDTSGGAREPLLPKFVSDHFQTERIPTLRSELRTVDRHYMVGKWTTDIRGAYAKFLLAGSPGLFHPEQGTDSAPRFALYYLLTRMPQLS